MGLPRTRKRERQNRNTVSKTNLRKVKIRINTLIGSNAQGRKHPEQIRAWLDNIRASLLPSVGEWDGTLLDAVRIYVLGKKLPVSAGEYIAKRRNRIRLKAEQSRLRSTKPRGRENIRIGKALRTRKGKSKRTRWTKEYLDYLKSPEWSEFRKKILAERGKKCQRCCKDTGVMHVHHLTYKNLTKELDEDVIVLCKECHMQHHSPNRDDSSAAWFASLPEGEPCRTPL